MTTIPIHWKTAVSGNFITAADWIGGIAPTTTNDAIIDATGTYTVTSTTNNTVNSLSLVHGATLAVSGSGTTFAVSDGTNGSISPEVIAGTILVGNSNTFATAGGLLNTGVIELLSTVSATNFEIGGNVALSGGGVLEMSNSTHNSIISNGSAVTFTNVDNTISGAGTIGDANLFLVNDQSGVIKATLTNTLIINGTNTVINLGTLEDTGTGGLQIKGTVNNATTGSAVGGVIEAVGATAHVDLNGADIIGGTLETNGGQIDTVTGTYNNELDGFSGVGSSLINAGKFVIINNSGLVIQGDIHNTGTIYLAGTGVSPQKTQLILTVSDATLDGGGMVVMTNNATNAIVTNGASATLTNKETISGAGTIGSGNQLTLDNEGLVNATGTIALVLNTGTNAIINTGFIETTGTGGVVIDSAVTNSGTLAAIGTGGMVLSGTVTGGVVIAQNAGSHVDLKGGTITGGGSIVTIRTGARLDTLTGSIGTVDENVDNAGTVLVANNSTLIESGTITNTGTFALSGTTAATVLSLDDVDGDLTFQGGGHLTLSNSALNAITASTSATLENVNNTISGAGTIGNANLTLQNDVAGIINANGTVALTISTGANPIANDGLLESTGSGGLVLDNLLTNGGTLLSAGPKQLVINSGLGNEAPALVETTGTGGLEITGTNNTNTGAIKALGTGALLIAGTVNNSGGTIGALASGSSIRMQTGTISEGLVVVVAGASLAPVTSTINTIGSATVDNAGSIVLANGSTLVLASDTVNNYGAITLNASSLATKLEISSHTTLQGGGRVILTNSTLNSIVSSGSPGAALNNVNDTISGAGTIGDSNLSLVNTGMIVANGTNALTLAAGAVNNQGGTIRTTGTGGIVFITTTATDNGGGTIQASGTGGLVVKAEIDDGVIAATVVGAHIDLSNGILEGATVSTVAGSTINALALTADSLLDDTVNNSGTIAIADNATLTADGLFNNVGRIILNSANDPTELELDADLTLTGGGLVTLTNNVNNSIISAAGPTPTLTNVNNTISGAGTIGDIHLTLFNGGTINANGTHALILNTGGNEITNAGRIFETGTGGLTIESDVGNSGTVSASGTGALLVENSTIDGGVISAAVSGAHIDLGGEAGLGHALISTVAGSRIDSVSGTTDNEIMGGVTNAGSIVVNDNSELTLDGPINNTGSILLSAAANATTLDISDDLALTGHGKVTLSNNINNTIESLDPATSATTTVTVGGEVSAGDTVSLTITNSEIFSSPQTVHYVVQSGDTTTTIATGLTDAVNAALAADNISADNGASPVITISEPGVVGNATVVSESVSGSLAATIGGTPEAGDTITLTFANSGLSNLPESVSYTVLNTDTSTTIATALKNAINADAKLTADDITATSSTDIITVNETGLDGTATTLTDTVAGSLTATINGSAVAGDTVSLTFTNSSFGTKSVSYTVVNGDTTTDIAAGLKTAINGDSTLSGAGITANSTTNIVTIDDAGTTLDQTAVSESITGTVTATIGGTLTDGDTLTLKFTNSSLFGSPVQVTYTVGTNADVTTTDIANDLAEAINTDATLTAKGITAVAGSSDVIITETNLSGNPTVVSESTSGGATETIGLSDAGDLPGETVALSDGGDVTTDTATVSTPGQLTGETLGLINSGDLQGGAGGSEITNVDNTISGAGTIGDAGMTLTNSVNGIIDANGTIGLTIDAGILINSGLIESTSTGGLTIGSGDVVINNGILSATAGLIDVKSAVTGTGTADMSGHGQIEFAAANTHQNVAFAAGANSELFLDNSQSFTGNISGFVLHDSIDLKDIDFISGTTTATWESSSTAGGTLVVTDGTHTTDLTLLGNYVQANFTVANDGSGHTLLTDPPVDMANHTIAAGATLTIPTAAAGTETFAGKTGTLVLDEASEFDGKVSGFSGQDHLDLADIGFGAHTTLGYAANGGNNGTLTVSDGTHTANLALLGNYIASSFTLTSDGHGGSLITPASQMALEQPVLTQSPHA